VLNLKQKLKKNKELVAVVSLPLVMMLLVAVIIYVPSLFIRPQYDFLYYTCERYCYSDPLDVVNSRVEQTRSYDRLYSSFSDNEPEIEIYYYSVEDARSKRISLSEAQLYFLDDSKTAPDGFKLESGDSYGGFLVFGYYGNNDAVKKLQKGTASFSTDIDSYEYSFNFLGWIENE